MKLCPALKESHRSAAAAGAFGEKLEITEKYHCLLRARHSGELLLLCVCPDF